MDDIAVTSQQRKHPRLTRHPLARAVAVSLMAAAMVGCASSGAPRVDTGLEQARSAYAQGDYGRAAQLLAIPAMQGNAEAQYALGYMYFYGRGVRQDRYRAVAWFRDASRLGHHNAGKALAMAEEQLRFAAVPPVSKSAVAQVTDKRIIISEIEPTAATTDAEQRPGAVQVQTPGRSAEATVVKGRVVITEPTPAPIMTTTESAPEAEAVAPKQKVPPQAPEHVAPGLIKASIGPDPSAPKKSAERPPRYTLQLLGSRSKADLVALVREHGLDASQAHYYAGEHAGGTWYRLFYGGYATVAEARAMLKALPSSLARHKPWVREFPAVKLASLGLRREL
jgi:septal ring-binding cell division protein DamX